MNGGKVMKIDYWSLVKPKRFRFIDSANYLFLCFRFPFLLHINPVSLQFLNSLTTFVQSQIYNVRRKPPVDGGRRGERAGGGGGDRPQGHGNELVT